MESLEELRRLINSLEASLDCWSSWLVAFTILVVVGLIVEYAHVVHELVQKFDWVKFTAVVGGMLVTVGVVGEVIVQFEASRVETGLRIANHKVEAILGKDAESAKQAAAEADREAKQFEQEKLKLKAAIKPRDLTKQEADALIATCRRFSGHTVKVRSYILDSEGLILAMQIVQVLRQSKAVTVCPTFGLYCLE